MGGSEGRRSGLLRSRKDRRLAKRTLSGGVLVEKRALKAAEERGVHISIRPIGETEGGERTQCAKGWF